MSRHRVKHENGRISGEGGCSVNSVQCRAVAYVRVSTDDQRLGPEAQRAAIEAWAERTGAVIASWCEDIGVSGAAPLSERRGLLTAIASLQYLGATVLVIARRDRLARDVLTAKLVERDAAKAGARIVCADGVGNGDTPTDALLQTMLDGIATFERELIRERTKAALGAKKARGERLGRPRYGWRVNPQSRVLEPVAAQQTAIARTLELRAAGATQRDIARELGLHVTQVVRILQSATENTKSSD